MSVDPATDPPSQPFLNDNWTLKVENLGEDYDHLRDHLVHMALHVQPPFAIAIQGGWGAGKTSMLRTVMCAMGGEMEQLDPEDQLSDQLIAYVNSPMAPIWKSLRDKFKIGGMVKTIWFNPWQHQFEGHPLVALLHEIRSQFALGIKLKSSLGKSAQTAANQGLRILGKLTQVLSVKEAEESLLEQEREQFRVPLDSQRFQLHFETAIHLLVTGRKPSKAKADAEASPRLVIFIDDLDRCIPDKVLHLLESIKLYLHSNLCVFLFGMDPDQVEQALKKSAQLKDPEHARLYMQKLFQANIQLPRPKSFENFIRNCLEQLNQTNAPIKRAEGQDREQTTVFIPEIFTNPLAESEKPLECNEARSVWMDYLEQIKTAEGLAKNPQSPTPRFSLPQLLDILLEGNPRRIKNFLNGLFLYARLCQDRLASGSPIEPLPRNDSRLILLLALLRYYYPAIHKQLEEHPGQWKAIIDGMTSNAHGSGISALCAFVARKSFLSLFESASEQEGFRSGIDDLFDLDHPSQWARYSFKQVFVEELRDRCPRDLERVKKLL